MNKTTIFFMQRDTRKSNVESMFPLFPACIKIEKLCNRNSQSPVTDKRQ